MNRKLGTIIFTVSSLLLIMGFCVRCLVSPYPASSIERWDLSRPAFKNVKLALGHGNKELAARTIVRYYEDRQQPAWPMTFNNVQRKLKNPQPYIDKADQILNRTYTILNQTFQLGPRLPWTKNPSRNPEWLWELNRHHEWVSLARAYALTRDERYARYYLEQSLDWIKRNPPPLQKDEKSPTWRLLETGLRMSESWIRAFGIFINSPTLDWKAKWTILNSIYDHGRFLKEHRTARNHLLMESNGLASVAVYFPEFREAPEWLDVALARLRQELHSQILPDGIHYETSTHYQWTCASVFEKTQGLVDLIADTEFSELLSRKLNKMYSFLAYAIRPDGFLPMINDGVQKDVRHILRRVSQLLQNENYRYAATAGKEGVRFRDTSMWYPFGGFSIMRSDWSHDSVYFFFDYGPLGGDHGHEDLLNFELWAYGQPMIVDPGTYTYDHTDRFRHYFCSSAAHNVVLVNGVGQARRINRQDPAQIKPVPAPCYRKFTPFVDYVSAAYQGNYGSYGHDKKPLYKNVVHRRMVLFVNYEYIVLADFLSCPQPVTYDLLFHFAPDMKRQAYNAETRFSTWSSGNTELQIIPAFPEMIQKVQFVSGETDPIQGWFSSDFNKKEQSPVLIYSQQATPKGIFITTLVPMDTRKKRSISIQTDLLKISGQLLNKTKGICLQVIQPEWTDHIFLTNDIQGKKESGSLTTKAQIAVFRINRMGQTIKTFSWSPAETRGKGFSPSPLITSFP